MKNIVCACCIIHNFLCVVDNDDSFIEEVHHELLEQDLQVSLAQPREDDYRIGLQIRDNIANEMWQHYVNN